MPEVLTIDIAQTKEQIRQTYGSVAELLTRDSFLLKRRSMLQRLLANSYDIPSKPDTLFQQMLRTLHEHGVLRQIDQSKQNISK